MKTIKRMPADIKVSGLSNMTKYFNQMQFNGIKEDNNIYAIDQMSLRDAKNVYIDDNLRLVSRPTLQYSDLPPEIPAFSELVDIKDFGFGKVYITKSVLNKYSVIIVPNTSVTPITGATFIIEELTNYHIATIEHYVICFNNINAKIFDTNNADQGWQNLTNYAEVPVVKRVVGETITTYDKNYFIPDLYKEEYIWSNKSHPRLPNGTNNTTITTLLGQFELGNIQGAVANYQILKPINAPFIDNEPLGDKPYYVHISCAKDIFIVAYENYMMISYNKGTTFSKVYYPFYNGKIRADNISKDGDYFFFITQSEVHRCNLSDLTWSKPFKLPSDADESNTELIASYFLTGDIFCFLTMDRRSSPSVNPKGNLYFKGPGLYSGDDYTDDHMDPSTDDHMDPSTDDFYELSSITELNVYSSSDQPTSTISLYDAFYYNTIQSRIYSQYVDKLISMKTFTDKNNRTVAGIVMSNPGYTGRPGLLMIYGGDTSDITSDTGMYKGFYQYAQTSTKHFAIESCDFSSNTIEASIAATVSDQPFSVLDYFTFALAKFKFSQGSISVDGSLVNFKLCSTGNVFEQKIPRYINTNLYLIDFDSYLKNAHTTVRDVGPYHDTEIVNPEKHINDKVCILDTSEVVGDDTYRVYEIPNTHIDNTRTDFNSTLTYTPENDIFYLYVDNQRYTDTGYAIWTNALDITDSASIVYTIGSAGNFTQVPTVSYTDTELYLAFDNLLQITYNTKDPDDPTKTLFNLPKINNQSFIDKITAMINISTTEISIFFLNKIIICSKVADENLTQGFRYDYYNTKLSTGVRLGDSVINTLEGSFTLFPTLRGLAAMNYQAFMATTDQTITYITDTVKNMWTKFYNDSEQIRIIQWRNRLVLTNGTGTILLYDLITQAWWRWKLSRDVLVALSNQLDLQVINRTLLTFKQNVDQYYDFGERGEFSEIDWYIMSQPLHFNAPNYYKNIKQLVFQMSEAEDDKSTKTMNAQIKLYRKKITIREPETVKFKIEELRTFVKRFNYWKINELQWGISNDTETSTPKRLELNGMSVKYEIGEEVR